MNPASRIMVFAAAALAFGAPSAAFAQVSPMPAATSAGMSSAPVTPVPESTSHSRSSLPGWRTTRLPGDVPPGAQVKALKNGSLTRAQVVYGLTHQAQEAKQVAQLKTVDFNRLRVYRLPTSLKTMFHVSEAESEALVVAMLGEGVQVAQTTHTVPGTNGSNAPVQHLRYVLADIDVSNALEDSHVNVALRNVLSGNKISIAQVVGVYIGGGIITTITK
jgi:hypothetical protein